MDRPEELARDYLISEGYSPIFEPRGEKTCPDFEINKSTAVEVRRLNENHFGEVRSEGLRTVSQPIWDATESVFAEYTEENPEKNYWVSLRIKRPVEKTKTIKSKLKQGLQSFKLQNKNQLKSLEVSPSITLELHPKEEIENQIFHLGSMLDFDSGGFVIPNLIKNMSFCIEQKTNKISSCHSKYENWWLILIDEISYGLKPNDKEYVASKINKPRAWQKIITLNTLTGQEILKI